MKKLGNDELKNRLKDIIFSLEKYSLNLRIMDFENPGGLERAFRIRIGDYRIIFCVVKKDKLINICYIALCGGMWRNEWSDLDGLQQIF